MRLWIVSDKYAVHLWLCLAQGIKGFMVRFPCIALVEERHPHRMCVGGSIPSAWVTEDMRMNDFLKFFDEKTKDFPMHLEITYSKICDWGIYIYKQGCANDYPGCRKDGDDAILVHENDTDMELCFAKAHVALKEWLIENNGGY